MTIKQKLCPIAEEFNVGVKALYNKEDDVPFIFMPSQKKVEIGEKITITIKHPNKNYDKFCDELTELIIKYQNGMF